jgi:hypothetical protein
MRKLSVETALADDPVHREPVSVPNSLLTGKNTGKFAKLSPWLLGCGLLSGNSAELHRIPNREFVMAEQGKWIHDQGNLRALFRFNVRFSKESGHAENRS